MSNHRNVPTAPLAKPHAKLFISLLLVFAPSLLAQADGPLVFFKNYVVTGDYAVGGAGLQGTGVNGFGEANITIPPCTSGHVLDASCLPVNTELIAAFLYWETKEASI